MAQLELLDPTAGPIVEPGTLAPRLDSLRGKRIGLWANMKLNSVELLDEIEQLLSSRYRIAGVVRGTYNAGRVMKPDEWGEIDRCDAALLTHGD